MFRFCYTRVGNDIPKIEVRFENLSVEGDAFVTNRALPTLFNALLNAMEVIFISISAHFRCLIIALPPISIRQI